jgi:hypothetical protein
MQERALELVGKKLAASLAIEGKLTDDGLVSMCAGEDMTLLLAKTLVEGMDVQGAESVWRVLNQQQRKSKAGTCRHGNVIPFIRKRWSLEMLEERAGMIDDYFLSTG